MQKFYFPLLFIEPAYDDPSTFGEGFIKINKREWAITFNDIFAITQNVTIYEVSQLYRELEDAHLEIEIDAEDYREAISALDRFRALIYVHGGMATIAPVGLTLSLNDIAGASPRSSEAVQIKEKERDSPHSHSIQGGRFYSKVGITNENIRLYYKYHELTHFYILYNSKEKESRFKLEKDVILKAIHDTEKWANIEKRHSGLLLTRSALVKAPLMPSLESSLLLCWQGMEAIFPRVSTEISFKLSLLLATLSSSSANRQEIYDLARLSYGDRSRIAHGNFKNIDYAKWLRTWTLLKDAISFILRRGDLPSEDALVRELLAT